MTNARCGALLTLVVIVAVGWGAPNRVSAQPSGTITGRLVNGTPDGGIPGGSEVVLHVFRGESHLVDRPSRADQDGAFRFDALEADPLFTYQVTAVYRDVTYGGPPVRLSAERPTQELEFSVFEPVDADPGLRSGWSVFVVNGADAERQELVVTELVSLVNPSERTFTPSMSGAAGPMGLLRFGLPAGARDLQPSLGLEPGDVVQVDRGFATAVPLAPGEHEFRYAYRVPYQEGRSQLEKSLPYGADTFRLLVPEGGPTVASAELAADESFELQGIRYQMWSARNIPAGTRIRMDVGGLPARPVWRQAAEIVSQPVVLPTALGLMLLGGVLWIFRRQRSTHAMVEEPATALVAALADLDEAFEAGRLTESAYQAQRAALRGRLQARLPSVDAPTAETASR